MASRFIDVEAPRYNGPLPKPHGLLPVPPEVAVAVAQEQARHQPYYTDDYAKLVRDNETLTYYYEGETVAYRSMPEGVEVLAVGLDEIKELTGRLTQDELLGITIGQP
jgi:hypothetical protein